MARGIELVELGWGGGYKEHNAEVLDFVQASGLLLAKKHTKMVYRLYTQGAMNQFDGMYLNKNWLPKSTEDNLIQESLEKHKERVNMVMILAVEAECQFSNMNNAKGKKAKFALDRYNNEYAGSLKLVYTKGENLHVAKGTIHLANTEGLGISLSDSSTSKSGVTPWLDLL